MDVSTLENIRNELASALVGRKLGSVFQLSRFELAFDFRLAGSTYLFISIEPTNPRIYLIKRRRRDLEKLSVNPSPFAHYLYKRLSGATLRRIERIPDERILHFEFIANDEFDGARVFSLVAQLTGRSANLFLLDENSIILEASRQTFGEGQVVADRYAQPFRDETKVRRGGEKFAKNTLSADLDAFYLEKDAEKRFQSQAHAAQSKLSQEISKLEKLIRKLNEDLARHGEAEKWKRFGDLLLANAANARREGNTIFVTDFYDENLPEVGLEVDENATLTEAAENFFKRFTKARNAGKEIAKRLRIGKIELEKLISKQRRLDEAISTKDEDYIAEITADKSRKSTEITRGKRIESNSGSRSFTSSDGFEILVGKKARDNDFLTFRVAKSLDLWMHAADYPGSHVVVRNPNRKEIPHTTLLEAAQIAAFYSQARSQSKVAIHYTQKKFVNKPRGAVAGLVSLASFKTILVEPKVSGAEVRT